MVDLEFKPSSSVIYLSKEEEEEKKKRSQRIQKWSNSRGNLNSPKNC